MRSKNNTELDLDYMANLSEVMMVLAVGIMLALVMAWQLNFKDISDMMSRENGLKDYGTVYVDEEGNFYMIEEAE